MGDTAKYEPTQASVHFPVLFFTLLRLKLCVGVDEN